MIIYDLLTQPRLETLGNLKTYFDTGKWVCFNQWLQRFEQQSKWDAGKKLKARQYMRRLLITKWPIQSFFVGHIDFVIEAVQIGKKEKPDLEELWELMSEWLTDAKEGGATHIIFDSQNRLKFGIQPFFKNNLPLSLNIDGEERNGVYFKDLDEETKNQVINHEVWVSYAQKGNIEAIVDQLVAMNEGIPWTAHEKRSTRLSPVALSIFRTSDYHSVRKLNKKLNEDTPVFNGAAYSLEKKGDSLFVAEMAHFLRFGTKGTDSSLDGMYDDSDTNLMKELSITNEMFLWVAKYLPLTLLDKHFTREMYRDIFIFTAMLIKATEKVHRSDEVLYNVKLRQIIQPASYLKKLVNAIQKKIQDPSNFSVKKDKDGNVILKDGKPVPYKSEPLPDSIALYHQGTKTIDFRGRERLFIGDFNKVVQDCVDEGIIQPQDARKMTKYEELGVKVKFSENPADRYVTSNIQSAKTSEIDHCKIPVKLGGTNDPDNLEYIPKGDNKQKGAA